MTKVKQLFMLMIVLLLLLLLALLGSMDLGGLTWALADASN